MRCKLKTTRLGRQLSQQEVANCINISQRNYSDIERGASNPSWAVAQRLEQFFGIPASELLAESKQQRQ